MFFHPSRKTYYSRLRIPIKFLPFFKGRVDCWKSLRTAVRSVAKLRSAAWETQGRRLFQTLEHRGHTMNKDQIESLVSGWLNTTLEEWEELRAMVPNLTMTRGTARRISSVISLKKRGLISHSIDSPVARVSLTDCSLDKE